MNSETEKTPVGLDGATGAELDAQDDLTRCLGLLETTRQHRDFILRMGFPKTNLEAHRHGLESGRFFPSLEALNSRLRGLSDLRVILEAPVCPECDGRGEATISCCDGFMCGCGGQSYPEPCLCSDTHGQLAFYERLAQEDKRVIGGRA